MATEKFTKLPPLAKPSLYTIRLKPDVEKFTCAGNETIEIEISEATDHLVLHANEIQVQSASATLADGSEVPLTMEQDKVWHKLTLRFPTKIAAQKATLKLQFESVLNDKMHGFYRSTYKDAAGNEKYLFSTQFESTYARQAFPCWDEPGYKAKFDVTLEVPEHLTALSNMNIIAETPTGNGTKEVRYATTPTMSTYLVAFAVGELEYTETKTKDGVLVRVYTVPGKKESGAFGLDAAKKALEYHAEWFGIPYPLPKCDLIAIPDFAMGAMENWGLVTYREITLLVDPKQTSTLAKTHVALVVGHELAHFWFGNLTTMKWWTDLWLKEGFASYFEYMFVGATYPEFKIWQHFAQDEVGRGFELDSLRSSHPIEVEINDPNELEEIYDSITYSKSNSIIRMLCNYLTEATFQKGMHIYLQRFQYNNATTADLWQTFKEASGEDIDKLMSTWTRQMGYPLISVQQTVDGERRVLKLKQERFISDGGSDERNSLWQVPILVSTSADPSAVKKKFLMTEREQEFVLEGVKPDEWVKLNAGTTGFYRVQYPEEMLAALLPAVASRQLPVLDRYGIANDLFALVESGRVGATQFLDFLRASTNEDEYIVWGAIDHGISALANVLNHHEDAALRGRFDALICKLLEPVGQRFGWQPQANEDPQTGILRSVILGRLSKCGHRPTIETAVGKFYEHANNGAPLVADLRNAIFSTVGRTEGRKGFDALRKIFETSGFSEVERSCVVSIGQTKEEDVLKAVYDYAVHESKVRPQDLMALFMGTSLSKPGQEFAWNFIKAHFKKLSDLFGGVNSIIFQRCFKLAASNQASSLVAEEFENFFKANVDEHNLRGLDRPIRQVTESIRLNEQLLKRNAEPIAKYLEQQGH